MNRKAPWTMMPGAKVTPPKDRKPIRRVSKKRQKDSQHYRLMAKAFLIANPRCAVFPEKRSTQVHHRLGRHGKNYLDMETWIAVSQAGHDRIHHVLPEYKGASGPDWARRMGFLGSFIAK